LRTRVLQVDPLRPGPDAIEEAAALLVRGGLVAFATETVYGLGAVATDPAAVARIYEAKGRPAFNPLIVHVAGIGQASSCTTAWPETADRLARRFWPGPLTLVLEASASIPEIVRGGRPTVALRAPATPVARGLIERMGQPLAAPSANRSNRLSPTTAEHVLASLDGRIDLVLDSGPTAIGLESTVLDLTRSPASILRPGPLGLVELEDALSGLERVEESRVAASTASPAGPGMLPVHYSPRTPAWRVDGAEELAAFRWPGPASLLVFGEARLPELPAAVECVRLGEPRSAAGALYRVLHDIDGLGKSAIVVLLPPDLPEWAAIRDRLMRAARPMPLSPDRMSG
jgi:L-threonylcarbamoyladenylate synthase